MKLFNKRKTAEEKRAELYQRMFEVKKQDGTWDEYNKRVRENQVWNKSK